MTEVTSVPGMINGHLKRIKISIDLQAALTLMLKFYNKPEIAFPG